MRGRKPKPTVLHRLDGTYNVTDHRDRAFEPIAEGALVEPPADLAAKEKTIWRNVIKHAPSGVLFKIDERILRLWVKAAARYDRAEAVLAKAHDDEDWIISPAQRRLDHTALLLIKLASELGFSPAARPRLRVAAPPQPEKQDDPWSLLKMIPGGKVD